MTMTMTWTVPRLLSEKTPYSKETEMETAENHSYGDLATEEGRCGGSCSWWGGKMERKGWRGVDDNWSF